MPSIAYHRQMPTFPRPRSLRAIVRWAVRSSQAALARSLRLSFQVANAISSLIHLSILKEPPNYIVQTQTSSWRVFTLPRNRTSDVIRGVRAFLEDLDVPITPEAPTKEPEAEAEPSTFELFWPSDWSKVILADEPEAALGAQFFTRTTPEQEDAIRAVRGVTLVEGIAGTGKTSVALGRLKFFANFRTGEHLAEYDLNPNDRADFDFRRYGWLRTEPQPRSVPEADRRRPRNADEDNGFRGISKSGEGIPASIRPTL